jgi:hypothetical protein
MGESVLRKEGEKKEEGRTKGMGKACCPNGCARGGGDHVDGRRKRR